MRPTFRLLESMHGDGHYGVHAPGLRPEYQSYRSPHAPAYKVNPNYHGINLRKATHLYATFYYTQATDSCRCADCVCRDIGRMLLTRGRGLTLGMFGGVAGIFAIFFFSDIPRVRNDIMQKIPIIGNRFKKEVPPEDNPF